MKRIYIATITVSLCFLLMGLASAYKKRHGTISPVALQAALAKAPTMYPEFTATLEEWSTDYDVARVYHANTRTVAVRANGDRMELQETNWSDCTTGAPSGVKSHDRNLFLVDGTHISAKDELRLKITTPSKPPSMRRAGFLDPATGCMKSYTGDELIGTKLAGTEIIFGVPTSKITNGKNVFWKAPSLRCEVIQQIWDFGSQVSTKKLISLVRGTPDPKLFADVDTYKEALPSEFKIAQTRWIRDNIKGERAKQQSRLDAMMPNGVLSAELQAKDNKFIQYKQSVAARPPGK